MPEDKEFYLEDESTWDYDKAEVKPPSQSNRVVVSVAFARQDFQKVGEYAESVNMKTSEFIRTATLDKISKPAEHLGFLVQRAMLASYCRRVTSEQRHR